MSEHVHCPPCISTRYQHPLNKMFKSQLGPNDARPLTDRPADSHAEQQSALWLCPLCKRWLVFVSEHFSHWMMFLLGDRWSSVLDFQSALPQNTAFHKRCNSPTEDVHMCCHRLKIRGDKKTMLLGPNWSPPHTGHRFVICPETHKSTSFAETPPGPCFLCVK